MARMLQNCPRCWGEHDLVDCEKPEWEYAGHQSCRAQIERLRAALIAATDELERVHYLLMPQYEGCLAEPNTEVIRQGREALGIGKACAAHNSVERGAKYHTGNPPRGARGSRSGLCWGDGHEVCVNPDCECDCGHPAQPLASDKAS